jgi:vancomycin resistance protein YoaR
MVTKPVQDEREPMTVAAPVAPPRRRWFTRPLQATGIIAGVVLALIGLEQLAYYNRILPGVQVDGVDVDQKTEDAAGGAIDDLAQRLQSQPIVARFGDRELTTTPDAVGLQIDAGNTTQAARDEGREDLNPLEILASPFRRLAAGTEVPLRVRWDDDKVAQVLAAWEQESVTGFVPGDVTFNGATAVPVPPVAGTTVDAAAAREPFEDALRSGTREPVVLPGKPVEPILTAADVQRVADHATAVLSAPYEIVTGANLVTITPDQLATALATTRAADGTGLALIVDPARLGTAVGEAAGAFTVPAVDARFAVNPDNTVSIVPSQDGLTLDFAALGAPILAQQRRIEAPLGPLHPARDTAWAESLGIKEQVSSFTTEHPCCASRVTNIHRAADLIQGSVVEPGQVFSLNDAVGPRTTARGFLEAPVYYQGFTTDVGGGVSQLSTTVYNAAWWAGLEIVEHQPHSIWITRYPAGREATLNYGSIDNKFRNNTQHGVLIHTSYTDTSITVSIYGDKEGKVVREENRQVTSGQQAAGAPFTVVYERVIDQPGVPQVREQYRWRYQAAAGS